MKSLMSKLFCNNSIHPGVAFIFYTHNLILIIFLLRPSIWFSLFHLIIWRQDNFLLDFSIVIQEFYLRSLNTKDRPVDEAKTGLVYQLCIDELFTSCSKTDNAFSLYSFDFWWWCLIWGSQRFCIEHAWGIILLDCDHVCFLISYFFQYNIWYRFWWC